jgi:hypothetical protein
MEWDRESVCYGGNDAKELVANVQERVEMLVRSAEIEASSALHIEWNLNISGWDQSIVQSLVVSENALI